LPRGSQPCKGTCTYSSVSACPSICIWLVPGPLDDAGPPRSTKVPRICPSRNVLGFKEPQIESGHLIVEWSLACGPTVQAPSFLIRPLNPTRGATGPYAYRDSSHFSISSTETVFRYLIRRQRTVTTTAALWRRVNKSSSNGSKGRCGHLATVEEQRDYLWVPHSCWGTRCGGCLDADCRLFRAERHEGTPLAVAGLPNSPLDPYEAIALLSQKVVGPLGPPPEADRNAYPVLSFDALTDSRQGRHHHQVPCTWAALFGLL